jgi:acyl-CoA synthetase (AMP-forming)/AMP-acid ligase II
MEKLSSLVELLELRASQQPADRSHVFLSDRGAVEASLTFGELHRRALALARRLAAESRPGDRALMVFPPGLDFVVGFFGCLMAGVIAVPIMIPRRQGSRDSSLSIAADCTPRLALTSAAFFVGTRQDVIARLVEQGMRWVVVDDGAQDGLAGEVALPRPRPDDVAFLQYTSGSTSAPKGVVVSHGNLLHMTEMMRSVFGSARQSACVGWLPVYHDLGLIGNLLHSAYVGALCVLMAPTAFMTRPLNWIRAVHEFRAEVTCAPNFAFDLCVRHFRPEQMEGVDLSSWRVALNGAEHIRAETLEKFAQTFAPYGFKRNALFPAYGLAEATLVVSSVRHGEGPRTQAFSRAGAQNFRIVAPASADDAQTGVSCGTACPGEQVAIVDPDSCRRLAARQIGEIWVSGPNICHGYWQNQAATAQTFKARIADEDDADWLRTGDLGFLDDGGELFITGRIKELIIVRGTNHYPQDIESTVQNCHPALSVHGGAAFAATDKTGQEILVVVQEVERTHRNRIDPETLIGDIREAVVDEHEIAPREVVLIRPGTLPKTTSGKIQRNLARQLWQDGKLQLLSTEPV